MIPPQEVQVLDKNSEFFGVPTSQLMENAGKAVAEIAERKFDIKGKAIVIVCGPGNNGGDGFVAGRYLKGKGKISVILAKPPSEIASSISKENYEKIQKIKGIRITEPQEDYKSILEESDIVIDALLGVGARGKIREPFLSIINAMNLSGKPVLSVDVPSGLGGDILVKPKVTVTFHDVKEGMNEENSGEIVVADIGIPKEAEIYVGPGEFVYYPTPKEDSHKGDNGRLLVVGGGPYTGAPALAGLAAYRIGVDIVHIATPTISYQVIASFSPNFIVHPLAGNRLLTADVPDILQLADKVDTIIIGPGLGESLPTREAVREVIKAVNKPLVIDADGITAVCEDLECLKGKKGVITPHAGEFQELSHQTLEEELEARKAQITSFTKKIGLTVLLKGRIDVISDGERCKLNRTGNAGMTVGGTGDVLSGIVGGLISKGVPPYNAARIAAFTNGYAGDLAFLEKSYGLVATDVIDKVPEVLKKFL